MAKVNRSDFAFVSFRFILFTSSMIFFETSVATDTLTQSQELAVGQTLVSSNQMFELGFFSPRNSSNRYIGIWYMNISWTKAVWVANREIPLSASDKGSVLTVGSDGNLKLLNGTKIAVWSTNVSSNPKGTIAVLSDKGDFILQDNSSGTTLWESFNYPSDSLIVGMKIGQSSTTGEKYVLNSWSGEDDPSPGEFIVGLTTETPPQNIMWKDSKPHWRSGPWNGWQFVGLYAGYSDRVYDVPSTSQVMIEFVTPDGNLKFSWWDIGDQSGGVTWQAIEVFCDVYGACGPFGVCDRSKPTCECLRGFVPNSEQEWNTGNWTSGCRRQTELACSKNTSTLSLDKKNTDDFATLSNMKVPDHYTYLFNANASDCEEHCLNNCSCEAYAYVDGIGCLTWVGELLDVQKFTSQGADVHLRLAQSSTGSHQHEGKKKVKLMATLISVFGFIILGAVMYGLYRCKQNRKALRKQQIKEWGRHASQPDSSELLPMIDFATLAAATNNFSDSNKLGAGGFGPVYKGKLEDGQEIAVKRLSSHSGQGAIEFKNEILLISKLQHRNLVKLLGYCIKDDEKLLIYEYLQNKSLDTFLFDTRLGFQLDWDLRFNIIEGIARGLLYLHRDSCLRVIHRDLKPSNILLDDNMNPKISDFGLARAFQVTQELANTHRVVGTFSYMSPEYAMRGLLSEKSDVFSFGVIILEIISGERNKNFLYEEKFLNLLGYAWCLWNEGKCLDFMKNDLSDSCSPDDFVKFMQIGLLCVQDHAIDRPTMSAIVLMIKGDTKVPQPKQPAFYQGLLFSDLRSQYRELSKNSISVTNMEGR